MKETGIQNEIRNALAGHCMLFRANVGTAWTGNDIRKLKNGAILIMDPRPFSTGLPPGFSDLFGLVTVEITQDMVGQKFAQFLAGEVKTATGRKGKAQGPFLDAIKKAGGRADVWRSAADALRTIGK
jgi:hypothetical protein